MGLNIDGTRFLLHAHKLGVDFSHTCMIVASYCGLVRVKFKRFWI